MSKEVSLAEGALSKDESGEHVARPKSGSLSSDEGDCLNPKQSRFFKNLSRSLDPAVAPPKKDFLSEYQKYKAKRAYNLHGIVKQETIDLGTSESTTTQSAANRRFSTGTNPPTHSLLIDSKTRTLPASHGARGPPPPVAPRKKSVNLPFVKEPAVAKPLVSPVHETSSYILSAAKNEQHKADPDFRKFRSLTGPTVFRPASARNGPSTVTRKITPAGPASLPSGKEEVSSSNHSEQSVGKETAGIPVDEKIPGLDASQKTVVDSTVGESSEVAIEVNKDDVTQGTAETEGAESVEESKIEKTVGAEDIKVEECGTEQIVMKDDVEKLEESQQANVEVTSSSDAVPEGQSSPSEGGKGGEKGVGSCSVEDARPSEEVAAGNTEVQESGAAPVLNACVGTTENKEGNAETDNNKISELNPECLESKTELPETKEEVGQSDDGILEKESKVVDQFSDSNAQKEQTLNGELNGVNLQGTSEGKQPEPVEAQNKSVEIARDVSEQEVESPGDVPSTAVEVDVVEDQKDAEAVIQVVEEEKTEAKEAAEAQTESVEVIGDVCEKQVESPGDVPATAVEISVEEDQKGAEAVIQLVEEEKTEAKEAAEAQTEGVEVIRDVCEQQVESPGDVPTAVVCNGEESPTIIDAEKTEAKAENQNATVEEVVDSHEKQVESPGDVPATINSNGEERQEVVDAGNSQPKDHTDKLSKMADLLISFSEDSKEKKTVNDGDLAGVEEELQKLNSCIEEMSVPQKQEPSAVDVEKHENIEAMRKEMEKMVNDFDTYL